MTNDDIQHSDDETKRKFAEALEKKKNNHFHADKAHGESGKGKTQGAKFQQKRMRRKSG